MYLIRNSMAKWIFNKQLLSNLNEVLDISVTKIARRCNISQPVLYHYIKGDVDISVQNFIQICNALRIPCHYFISEDEHQVILHPNRTFINTESWENISWNYEAVEQTFGDGEGKIYWKDVAEVMEVSSQKPHERFLLHTRFPINSFLQICTYFNLSPFRFLVDSNSIDSSINKNGTDIDIKQHSESRENNKSKAPTLAELSKKMDILEKSTADLMQKYAALQEKNEQLLRHYKDLLNSIKHL